MSLALDDLPARSGQLTPVQAMGPALLDRLVAAGIEFRVLERSGR
jgi:saccharopine dehydrogenase (NAD+, L-glutamate forming)